MPTRCVGWSMPWEVLVSDVCRSRFGGAPARASRVKKRRYAVPERLLDDPLGSRRSAFGPIPPLRNLGSTTAMAAIPRLSQGCRQPLPDARNVSSSRTESTAIPDPRQPSQSSGPVSGVLGSAPSLAGVAVLPVLLDSLFGDRESVRAHRVRGDIPQPASHATDTATLSPAVFSRWAASAVSTMPRAVASARVSRASSLAAATAA